MAVEEDGCETCPFLVEEGETTRTNKVCAPAIDYPFSLVEMNPRIVVDVESEEHLAPSLTEFTQKVFSVLGRPGISLHHRAFLRFVVDGRRHDLCVASFPTPTWARLLIEQISFDTAGMSPRLLYNDRPWVSQPAIYIQAYRIISKAKSLAREWADAKAKREGAK